jgi:hypothetical protein
VTYFTPGLSNIFGISVSVLFLLGFAVLSREEKESKPEIAEVLQGWDLEWQIYKRKPWKTTADATIGTTATSCQDSINSPIC